MDSTSAWTLRILPVALLTLGVVTGTVAAAAVESAGPAGTFRCEASDTRGIPPADAAAAVGVVCEALARESHRAGSFHVALGPLGRSVVIQVVDDATSDSRSLQLTDLEETPTAAPRLARALVAGLDVEQTQARGTLVSTESREMLEKQGSLKISLGATGSALPSRDVGTGAGLLLGLSYRTSRAALYGDMLWAWSSDRENEAHLFSMASGARYYLSNGSFSPYLAGGAGLLTLGVDDDGYSGKRTSFAPHVEAGVECLRLHRAQLTAGVRAYVPLTKVDQSSFRYDPRYGNTASERSIYAMPVVFGMTFSFGG